MDEVAWRLQVGSVCMYHHNESNKERTREPSPTLHFPSIEDLASFLFPLFTCFSVVFDLASLPSSLIPLFFLWLYLLFPPFLLHLYIRRPSTSFFFILILLTCSSLSLLTHSSRLSRPVLIQTSPTTYSFNTNDNKLISHPFYSFPPSHTSVSRAFLTLL